MKPFLSIVIANYNYGRFLSEAIESLLSQSCQDFEIIIIDGGSTDNSVEVIKKYAGGLPSGVEREKCLNLGIGECLNDEGKKVDRESRSTKDDRLSNSNIQTFKHSNNSLISYWVSEPDKGQSHAFNKGFAHAHGRFLTWLNADDVMLPGTIERLRIATEKHPDCEWFVGGVLWLDPEMRIINCGRGRPFSEIRYRCGQLSVWGPSSFFTKRLLDHVGGIDERFHYMMDTELWLRFAYKGNVRYRPFCKYAFGLRLHPGAKMSGHNFDKKGRYCPGTANDLVSDDPKMVQVRKERKWLFEQMPLERMTRTKRVLSISPWAVLLAHFDLWRFRGKHFKRMFGRKKTTPKVAYVSIHPAPYRDAFLSQLVKDSRLDVKVYSLFPNDAGHKFWNLETPHYQSIVLCDYNMPQRQICKILLRTFLFSDFDHICWPGFMHWGRTLPLMLLALMGRHYSLSVDTVAQRKISRISYILKRWLVRRSDFIFMPGEASVRFFEKEFAISRHRLVKGAYALDGDTLESKIAVLRRDERADVRRSLGIDDSEILFLMVANMIPTRHYPITSAAFIRFASLHPEVKFVMVGKGPETEKMQELAATHNCLRVISGRSFDEMLGLYAAADVYVHGGTEPASTALIIGAIAHLPLVTSSAVGCYYDVLRDGLSGVDVGDYLSEEKWCSAFERILSMRSEWKTMGTLARELSTPLDVGNCVDNFIRAIMSCE